VRLCVSFVSTFSAPNCEIVICKSVAELSNGCCHFVKMPRATMRVQSAAQPSDYWMDALNLARAGLVDLVQSSSTRLVLSLEVGNHRFDVSKKAIEVVRCCVRFIAQNVDKNGSWKDPDVRKALLSLSEQPAK